MEIVLRVVGVLFKVKFKKAAMEDVETMFSRFWFENGQEGGLMPYLYSGGLGPRSSITCAHACGGHELNTTKIAKEVLQMVQISIKNRLTTVSGKGGSHLGKGEAVILRNRTLQPRRASHRSIYFSLDFGAASAINIVPPFSGS